MVRGVKKAQDSSKKIKKINGNYVVQYKHMQTCIKSAKNHV